MPEYIDREKAKFEMIQEMCGTGYQSWAVDVINRIPTADVVEVRHGHKIIHKRYRGFLKIECPVCKGEFPSNEPYTEEVEYCSECGKKLDDTFQNYCPNCGAKMDGKEVTNK